MSERGLPKSLDRLNQAAVLRVADFLNEQTDAPGDFSSALREFAGKMEHDEAIRLPPVVQEAIRAYADGESDDLSIGASEFRRALSHD